MNLDRLRAVLGVNQPSASQPAAAPAATTETALSVEQETALTTALTEARAEGKAEGLKEGAKASGDRFAAILGDPKVKGRERAALDLAMKSPEMSAADVVAFVAEHGSTATATIAQRMAGQGTDLSLGAPITNAPAATGSWDKAIAKLPGARTAAGA